ncbi:MAG: serine kinase [Caulobacteraceae bacterium]|nr:serine kinase [Caulobacteraceae bacterium]
MTAPIHATCVARYGPEGWRAVLLNGPSGAGKSDLALRLIGQGWRLVADDYCDVWASGGALWARAPDRIAGRIEVRGVGIVSQLTAPLARVALIVRCGQETVERLPRPETEILCGISLPVLTLDTRPASAPNLVEVALTAALAGLDVAPL